MSFRTVVHTKKSEHTISHTTSTMLLGSCFAQHIATKLLQHKLPTYAPFGVLYNPSSIACSLNSILEKKVFSQQEVFFQHEMWKSYAFHSTYNDASAENLVERMNTEISTGYAFLQNCNTLIITLGTAYVYTLKETGEVVANCHKSDAALFTRKRLDMAEIVSEYTELINRLLLFNPNLSILCTVSPIRHWKDGAHENQLSKSILLLAIDSLQKQYTQVHYFPSYELVLDDLRDYRFYERDMLHPNSTAIDYVWKAFGESYFSQETKEINREVADLVKSESHRPINPDSTRYLQFIEQHAKKRSLLRAKYPYLNI